MAHSRDIIKVSQYGCSHSWGGEALRGNMKEKYDHMHLEIAGFESDLSIFQFFDTG